MRNIGTLSSHELQEIMDIFHRKNALRELLLSFTETINDSLYNKILSDLAKSSQEMNEWWSEIALEKHWVYEIDDLWRVDFENGNIYLYKNQPTN